MRKLTIMIALSAVFVFGFSLAVVGSASALGTPEPLEELKETAKWEAVTPMFGPEAKGVAAETKEAPQQYRVLEPEADELSPSKIEQILTDAAGV